MVNGKVVISSKQGINVSAAGVLSKIAIDHSCSAYLKVRTFYVNAKSILGILSAQVKEGEEIEFVCDGADEQECLDKLIEKVKTLD